MRLSVKTYDYILLLTVVSALILSGCSYADGPTNMEPDISLNEVANVTRNDATLSAHVTLNGSEPLSYLRFRYGETADMEYATDDISPVGADVSAEIHKLKAGTTYYYCAVAGSKTAKFKTQTLSFTTLPNASPAVMQAKVLSSGPTCVMVAFDITSDGGDPITEAGCEIYDVLSGNSRRVTLPNDQLCEGSHSVILNSLTPLAEHRIVAFAANRNGLTKGEPLSFTTGSSIILGEAGILDLMVGKLDMEKDKISISGLMDGSDFRYLRSLLGALQSNSGDVVGCKIENVDVSDVRIVKGGKSYDDSHFTEDDCITTGLFGDCSRLRAITLPMSALYLRRDAFANCALLETIDISASVTSILPSSACQSLSCINIAPNAHYTSVDGVLFDNDVTEIIWFPIGKSGEYELPPTVTAIGQNAFRGAKITKLAIGNSVKTISPGAFSLSAIADISLPDNLTNISQGLFQDCANLKTIRLGKGCEYLGSYVFDGSALVDLHVAAEIPPYVKSDTFDDRLLETGCLYVPRKSLATYRNHLKWGKFKTIVAED